MKKILFRKLLFDCFYFFIITLLSTSIIIWVFQAVNFLDIMIEDGRDYLVYINYSYFIDFLINPLKDAGYSVENIFAITIYEGFQVKISNVILISLSILFPLILINLGFFIKPALNIKEGIFYNEIEGFIIKINKMKCK